MKYLALLLLMFALFTQASEFSSRLRAGQMALSTPSGKSYEHSWGEVMRASLTSCVPIGTRSTATLGTFTFVANVSSSGSVSDVEVRPVTAVSQCFAKYFGGAQLPAPPGIKHVGYLPVADSVDVTP